MKTNYIFSVIVSLFLIYGVSSCDKETNIDANNKDKNTTSITPIEIDKDTLLVAVHQEEVLNIKKGEGQYKVITENKRIATASIENNVIKVKSEEKGITGIIISDASGQYKRIIVKSMYLKMGVNSTDVNIDMKLGHQDAKKTIRVTEGNGEYTATSANEDIVKVIGIADDRIEIQALKEGKTILTITDMMGLSVKVNVKVKTTTIPFTEEEKAKILKNDANVIWFDGNQNQRFGSFTLKKDGNPKIKWGYFGGPQMSISFDGDFGVGKKQSGSFRFEVPWQRFDKTWSDMDIEIIKNDGTRIWGIMSVIQNNYLHCGYFSVKL